MKKTFRLIIITSILLFLGLGFTEDGLAKLSKKYQAKLNTLTEISKPQIPIFGKINEPIHGNISFSRFIPHVIYPEDKEIRNNTIRLETKNNKKDKLSLLETKRSELHKIEEEGLNFIQPSLELTTDEQKAIDEFFTRNEQEQLLNLWKATIERNKTIQFIVQKLTPATNVKQANSVLAKTLGAAIFLPFYALQALGDNAGAYYGSQVGGRVLGSVLEGKMKKDQSQMQLSQTESVILFMMIDEVAERLRQRYHDYKKLMIERALATKELEETKKDSLEAQESNSPGAQLISGIQRRGVEREIRRLDAQIRAQKNALVELAGPGAVNDLENQLRLELAATQNTPLDF